MKSVKANIVEGYGRKQYQQEKGIESQPLI